MEIGEFAIAYAALRRGTCCGVTKPTMIILGDESAHNSDNACDAAQQTSIAPGEDHLWHSELPTPSVSC
ncbi:hypothetical protein IG631_17024 [Alternaria alternata]|nr:hypothetical protein IG631_17024 [Alternaria alternata]